MENLKIKIDNHLKEITKSKKKYKDIDLVKFKTSIAKSKDSIYITVYSENEIGLFKRSLRISNHHTNRKGLNNKKNYITKHPNRKKTFEQIERKIKKMIYEVLRSKVQITAKVITGGKVGNKNKT